MLQTRLSWTLTALMLASAVLTSLAAETALTASSNSTATAISSANSGELGATSVRTEEPQTTVTSTSSESSSFPVWIIIVSGIVVLYILALVGGTMYARWRKKQSNDTGRGDSGSKAFDLTSTSCTESVLATSRADYAASDSSMPAAGAMFLKSDSRYSTDAFSPNSTASSHCTTASSRSTTSTAARIAALGPPPAIQPSSSNSFRGSQHVKALFIDDLMDPLDVSQLTTEVSHSVRESADAFHMNSPHSEWMSSALYDDSDDDGSHSSIGMNLHDSKISMLGDDGGNASGSTDFYASAITVLDDDDDDDFLRRKSERVETESVTKWKQKFYVEL